jgi:uncharacterized phage protein gp47/JayE
MAGTLFTFVAKDPATIRDDYLRTVRYGLMARGIANPNIGPDSDEYVRAQGLANELAVVEANAIVKADDQMPDTATGAGLDRWLVAVGLSRRPAAPSIGSVVFSASAASLVTTGAQLVDAYGQVFKVTTGGTYNSGDLIPVLAVSTGALTNHAAGDVLQWQQAPAYSAPTALVGTGGLVNGGDAEDDESARNRLLQRLANPPRSGNAQHVADLTIATHPSVQAAFVYPALQGGGTMHVATVAAPTATSKNRDVAAVTMSTVVAPALTGALVEHTNLVVTTVVNDQTSVAIGLSLPSSPAASPPGPGGGWLDGTPWPSRTSSGFCDVTSVTSTTRFLVNADQAPTVGTRICWLSPATWTLYTATITAVNNPVATPWDITVDTPWPNLTVGSYIFPQAQNMATYVAAFLASMALMGPGEKTSNTSALIRGFRHPPPQNAWPYALGPTQLRAVTNAGTEVLDISYLSRTLTQPALAGSLTSPPHILVPYNIGFYKQ